MAAPPTLKGAALKAVKHRGSHMQIIASAGSGKTEVVSQRVADLLVDGVPAEGIVAFTFTERAAEELKARIASRVEFRLGPEALDRLNGLYVGTIHAYCFRFLQQQVPRYEAFDVLDDNQLTAFLSREATRLNLRELDPNGRFFMAISAFIKGVGVVENELLNPLDLPEPFGETLTNYYETLDRYRLMTYGLQIAKTVEELEKPAMADRVHEALQHLIVDEYQDVNPAQERLIELLTGPRVELCVVGDDQQAIYQWRGADVTNIIKFDRRYPDVATFEITTNYRSLPEIIDVANDFAESIPDSLEKEMLPARTSTSGSPQVVEWSQEFEQQEAARIAELAGNLNKKGVPFKDIAVLVRGKASYPRLINAFEDAGIPIQPGGWSGLFNQPEAIVIAKTFCWLTDLEWREGYGNAEKLTDDDLFDEFQHVFGIAGNARGNLETHLFDWKGLVPSDDRTADLVGELYELLVPLELQSWDFDDPISINRLGAIARFSALLADYESVRRRSRPDPEKPGEQVGGESRGTWYYRNLGYFILNHAQGAYEGFEGEDDYDLDAVDLTTVHRAKGLEWPVVFVPALTKQRFPSSRTGRKEPWLVPRGLFNAERYEGSDADERRLFYVAITRARDWLSLSRHEKVNKPRTKPSPYYDELSDFEIEVEKIEIPPIELKSESADDEIYLTFSELASFIDCGMAYRLRNLIGFQPRLAQELGYGKAVHHVLRSIAEVTKDTGNVPSKEEVDHLFDTSFFLPTANKPAHKQLKGAARRLIDTYTAKHKEDLFRVWETERPFELHLDGVTISGRADVILDKEAGSPDSLAIVDYKRPPMTLAITPYSFRCMRTPADGKIWTYAPPMFTI